MTTFQKAVKYLSMAFAIFLIVSIFVGILGAVGFLGGLSDNNGVLENMKAYTVSENIAELKVDINAADFKIVSGDSFSVESNLKDLKIEEIGGCLKITHNKKFAVNFNNAELILSIPQNVSLIRADITTAAGRLTVDTLSADRLRLELGAGQVNIYKLVAVEKSEINGGAGQVNIKDGQLKDLDLDMGIGELNLTSRILGNCDFDLGVGESNLNLIGQKEDYRIEIDKGVGSVNVAGERMKDDSVYGNGQNRIDIDSGVGSVNIKFND